MEKEDLAVLAGFEAVWQRVQQAGGGDKAAARDPREALLQRLQDIPQRYITARSNLALQSPMSRRAMMAFPSVTWICVAVTAVIVVTTVFSGVEYFIRNWKCLGI